VKRFLEKCHSHSLGLDLHVLCVMIGLRQLGVPYVSLLKSVTLAFEHRVAEAWDDFQQVATEVPLEHYLGHL
jgi:hypothetical protein